MKSIKRTVAILFAIALLICSLAFGLLKDQTQEVSLNDLIVDLNEWFPKEPIQLTNYASKIEAKLHSPRLQDTAVNSILMIDGTIGKEKRLSLPYLWVQVDYLDGKEHPFHYYVPVNNQKFSQPIQLFAGRGDYRVTLRVPSPDDEEKYYPITSFHVYNVNKNVEREIEYSLNALETSLQIQEPVTSHKEVNQVFQLRGKVSEQTEKLLVQMTKGKQEWKRTISARKGSFSETLPLLFGQGTYHIQVMVPGKKEGYFIQGASFYVENRATTSFQPIRYTSLYHERGVQLFKPLTSGDHAGLYYNIDGKIDPSAPYAKQTTNIIVQTVKGKDKATYFIPVHQFRFRDSIPFRFGPGKYEVTLFVPDLNNKNRNFFRFFNVATFDVISNVDQDYRHLLPSRGIQSDDPEIKRLAKEITKGKTTNREKAKAIFRFVATYMDYDMNKLRNEGFDWDDSALKSLQTRKGVCQDYVFLGLALLRSQKIPSRFVEGEAGNQRHAWIEVLIDGKWMTMDPTWGSGYITPNGKFVKRYDERYFDPPLHVIRKTHRRTGVVY